jgi:hypothetical protein
MPAPYRTPKGDRIAEILDAELEAEVADAIETLSTAKLREAAAEAMEALDYPVAARLYRAAIARHPGNPALSQLAARDLALLAERAAVAESLAENFEAGAR